VGIGTASPGATLAVNGNVIFGSGHAGNVGDLGICRPSSNIGAIYFGSGGSTYLVYDGTQFSFAGGSLAVSNGDMNISGVYRVNGTPISTGGIATQTYPARAFNTTYQNTTGKPMFVAVTSGSGSGLVVLTDAGNPPTAKVLEQTAIAGGVVNASFWVLPGNWYQVQGGGTPLHWTEWY